MSDKKISQLLSGGASQAADEYPIARSGANFKVTGANIAAAATSVGTLTSLAVSGVGTFGTAGAGTGAVAINNSTNGCVLQAEPDALRIAVKGSAYNTGNRGSLLAADGGFSGALTVSGNLTVDTNTLFVDAANNRVGVGTASPGATFHVNAPSGSNTNIALSENDSIKWYIGNVTGSSTFRFYDNTAGAERLRIDASGNLGLGVTPSAWADYKALQTTGAAFIGYSDGSSNNQAILAANAFFTTGSVWKYINTDNASYYRQYDGTHAWFNAPSGTAGNAISFTQAMTLDASGNLGIGTASPTISAAATGIDLYDATDVQFRLHTGVSGTGLSDGFVLSMASDNTVYLYGYENAPMIFATNNNERARITSGGYFKASNDGTYIDATSNHHEFRGTTSDNTIVYATHTHSTNPYGFRVRYTAATPNNTDNWFFYCDDSAAQRFSVRSNGGVYNYQANDSNLSDERVKTDIKPVGSYWDKFKAIEIVTFKYVDQTHDDDNIGVIAQQVERVAPEFINVDGFGETPEDGVPLKSVYTTDMYHASIKTLQEAMARIEALEARLEALEA